MIPKHEPRSSFGAWLLKYRLLIIIITFVVVIPIAFVAALYIGDYIKYKDVDFSLPNAQEKEIVSTFLDAKIKLEDETEHQVIVFENDDLIIYIKLDEIVKQQYVDTNGFYKFYTRWESKRGNDISNVNVTFILQTQWINAKSSPVTFPLNKTYPNAPREIIFNAKLPQSPLWFVTVERPDLYVKVTYDREIGLTGSEAQKVYFKSSLLGITPIKELPEDEE
jgi:hypothetical protein